MFIKSSKGWKQVRDYRWEHFDKNNNVNASISHCYDRYYWAIFDLGIDLGFSGGGSSDTLYDAKRSIRNKLLEVI